VVCAAGHSKHTVFSHARCRSVHAPVVELDAVAHQHLREPVTSAHQIQPQRLARANKITQRLLLRSRHADRVQLAGEQQPDEMLDVTRRSSPLARQDRHLADPRLLLSRSGSVALDVELSVPGRRRAGGAVGFRASHP
jgi:hypothetical protein